MKSAIAKAHQELMAASRMIPVWSNAQWGFPSLAGHATAYSYRTEDSYDSDERGVLFYLACAPAHKPAPRRSMCCLLTAAR